jgi:hypothetical protein
MLCTVTGDSGSGKVQGQPNVEVFANIKVFIQNASVQD